MVVSSRLAVRQSAINTINALLECLPLEYLYEKTKPRDYHCSCSNGISQGLRSRVLGFFIEFDILLYDEDTRVMKTLVSPFNLKKGRVDN